MKIKNHEELLPLKSKTPLELCNTIAIKFHTLPVDQLQKIMFVNGWRLKPEGVKLLSKLYVSYESTNPENLIITGKVILKMDKCVNSPWYIRGKKITVFNQTAYFELQMVDGDINRYIDFKSSTF